MQICEVNLDCGTVLAEWLYRGMPKGKCPSLTTLRNWWKVIDVGFWNPMGRAFGFLVTGK